MMKLPAKVICSALCSATLLAPLVSAQVLKGKPQAQPQTPTSRDSRLRPALKAKFGPLQNGPTISNPSAVSHDAAIIASELARTGLPVGEARRQSANTILREAQYRNGSRARGVVSA